MGSGSTGMTNCSRTGEGFSSAAAVTASSDSWGGRLPADIWLVGASHSHRVSTSWALTNAAGESRDVARDGPSDGALSGGGARRTPVVVSSVNGADGGARCGGKRNG